MTRAQIMRKKTGIILAITGIVLSLLPAVRMADGTKLFLFQIIGNEKFFAPAVIAGDPETFLMGLLFSIVLSYGLFVHILNLFLWIRKKETTYIGVMALSWGSFLALIGAAGISSFLGAGVSVALFPLTIWQSLRILITLSEAIIKLNGEELFKVFFPEK